MNPSSATLSGRLVNPFNIDPALVDFDDIAQSLSKIARWAGHTRETFTVAAHSILVMLIARRRTEDPKVLLRALMHDAFESYMGDIKMPVKSNLTPNADVAPGLSMHGVEENGLRAIFDALGIERAEKDGAALGDVERWADSVALEAERVILTGWQRDPSPEVIPTGAEVSELHKLIGICSYGHRQIAYEFGFYFVHLKGQIENAATKEAEAKARAEAEAAEAK